MYAPIVWWRIVVVVFGGRMRYAVHRRNIDEERQRAYDMTPVMT